MSMKTVMEHLIRGTIKDELCRVCLQEKEDFVNVDESLIVKEAYGIRTYSLVEIFKEITEFEDSAELPTQICEDCIKLALSSFMFKQQCKMATVTLHTCVSYLEDYLNKIDNSYLHDSHTDKNDDSLVIVLPHDSIFDYESIIQRCQDDEKPEDENDYPREIKKECEDETLENVNTIDLLHTLAHSEEVDEQTVVKREYQCEAEIINETVSPIFICDYCNSIFTTKNAILHHISQKHNPLLNLYSCRECGQKFKKKGGLFKHKQMHLKDYPYGYNIKPLVRMYNCTMCAESFVNRELLRIHREKHPEGTMHICRDCGKMYKTSMALRQHSFIHSIKTKNHLCTICGKAFLKRSMLNTHIKTHDAKVHKCPMCNVRCQTLNKVKYHIKQVHQKEYKYMCDECGQLLPSSGELGIHKERHVLKICPTCGKTYKDRKQYESHLKKHESGLIDSVQKSEKRFTCDYCGLWWKQKWCLVQHVYGKHVHNRPYKCEICGKGFYTKPAQIRHNIVHTKLRPEVCTLCNKRFVDKRALLFHTRIHSGEKPYECAECGERFLNASRRLAHMKSKHLEPTEECTICHKKFSWKKTLRKHMEKHDTKMLNLEVGNVELMDRRRGRARQSNAVQLTNTDSKPIFVVKMQDDKYYVEENVV